MTIETMVPDDVAMEHLKFFQDALLGVAQRIDFLQGYGGRSSAMASLKTLTTMICQAVAEDQLDRLPKREETPRKSLVEMARESRAKFEASQQA